MLAEDWIIAGANGLPGFPSIELAVGGSVTVPDGAVEMAVIVVGAGGNGVSPGPVADGNPGGGGGGGGAYMRMLQIPVTAGQTVSVANETVSGAPHTTVRINGTAVIGAGRGGNGFADSGGSAGSGTGYKAGVAASLSFANAIGGYSGASGGTVSGVIPFGGNGGSNGGYPGGFPLAGVAGQGGLPPVATPTNGANYGAGGGGGGSSQTAGTGSAGRARVQWNAGLIGPS